MTQSYFIFSAFAFDRTNDTFDPSEDGCNIFLCPSIFLSLPKRIKFSKDLFQNYRFNEEALCFAENTFIL